MNQQDSRPGRSRAPFKSKDGRPTGKSGRLGHMCFSGGLAPQSFDRLLFHNSYNRTGTSGGPNQRESSQANSDEVPEL